MGDSDIDGAMGNSWGVFLMFISKTDPGTACQPWKVDLSCPLAV